MFTLINPTKTEDLSAYVVSSQPCPTCKEVLSIAITPESLFLYNQGANVQTVLVNYPPSIRDRFMTGFCDECWNLMFVFDEED
jgi:hypothetical protein